MFPLINGYPGDWFELYLSDISLQKPLNDVYILWCLHLIIPSRTSCSLNRSYKLLFCLAEFRIAFKSSPHSWLKSLSVTETILFWCLLFFWRIIGSWYTFSTSIWLAFWSSERYLLTRSAGAELDSFVMWYIRRFCWDVGILWSPGLWSMCWLYPIFPCGSISRPALSGYWSMWRLEMLLRNKNLSFFECISTSIMCPIICDVSSSVNWSWGVFWRWSESILSIILVVLPHSLEQ